VRQHKKFGYEERERGNCLKHSKRVVKKLYVKESGLGVRGQNDSVKRKDKLVSKVFRESGVKDRNE